MMPHALRPRAGFEAGPRILRVPSRPECRRWGNRQRSNEPIFRAARPQDQALQLIQRAMAVVDARGNGEGVIRVLQGIREGEAPHRSRAVGRVGRWKVPGLAFRSPVGEPRVSSRMCDGRPIPVDLLLPDRPPRRQSHRRVDQRQPAARTTPMTWPLFARLPMRRPCFDSRTLHMNLVRLVGTFSRRSEDAVPANT